MTYHLMRQIKYGVCSEKIVSIFLLECISNALEVILFYNAIFFVYIFLEPFPSNISYLFCYLYFPFNVKKSFFKVNIVVVENKLFDPSGH